MSSSFAFNQDFNSDDEEQSQYGYSGTREACIVVIDASAPMFAEIEIDEKTTCLFAKCLAVLERCLLNKIISNSKDLFGVILYNTKDSPDPAGDMTMESPLAVPKNCAILVPLKHIEANIIRYVKNLKSSDDFMDFDNKFGHTTDGKVADILWLCSTMFAGCGKKIRIPQVMWFTHEDLPHREGSSDHQQAFQKAKDLQQFQIDLQFYPLKTNFDGDLFYKELICLILGIDLDDYQFPIAQLDEKILLQRVFRRSYSRRALSHLSVEISENIKFGVSVYNFTRKSVVPKAVPCTRDKNQPITAKRAHKFAVLPGEDDDEIVTNMEANLNFAEKLEPSKTVKYQQVGGEKINFTVLEAYEIKQVMDPKIKVLGFKPSSVLSDNNFIRATYFIYPNDTYVKNSTVIYRALWERCLLDKKVIICISTMKLKSYPRLVALVPQEQSTGPDGEILRYDGFRIQFIPFAGDIRDLSEMFVSAPEVDGDLLTPMKKLIGRLCVNYNPTMFENPVVTKIYQKIEEKEFGDDSDEDLNKDTTLPNLDAQDDRIGQFVMVLDQLIGGFEEMVVTKRKADNDIGTTQRKKATPDDVNQVYVLQMCKELS